MNLFFWLLLNLGVPVVGPLFMLALLTVTHGKAVAQQLMMESVKDGQLFWSAIALSAAAIYETVITLEDRKVLVPILELAVVVFGLIAFMCSILVMLATLKAYSDRTTANDSTAPAAGTPHAEMSPPSSATVTVSIWLTSIAAFLSTILHAYASQ